MSSIAGDRPRRRRRQEVLSDSLAAARRLLADGGVESVTMLAVSRAVGIAGPGLYRYFPSRADLLRATYRHVLDELVAHVRAAVARQPEGDRAAEVQALTNALFAWCVAHPDEFDLLLGAGLRLADEDAPVGGESGGGTFYEVAALAFPAVARQWADGATRFDGAVPPGSEAELTARRDALLAVFPDLPRDVPLALVAAVRVAWQRTFGLLCLTVYDHVAEPDGPGRRGYITALLDDLNARNLALFGMATSPAAVLEPVFADGDVVALAPRAAGPGTAVPAAGGPGAYAAAPAGAASGAVGGSPGAGAPASGAGTVGGPGVDGPGPGGRRARLRRELLADALSSARRLLDEHGPAGVTMQAVAKDVGIAAPGLYRYFDGRPGLLHATHEHVVDELLAAVEQARARQAPEDLAAQAHAVVHTLFRWCLAHRNEYDLLMSGRRRISRPGEDPRGVGGASLMTLDRVGSVFTPIALGWWQAGCPVVPDDEIPPALVPHLRAVRDAMSALPGFPAGVPLGLLHSMNLASARLWGLLTLTVYGHVGEADPASSARLDALVHDLVVDLLAVFGQEVSDDVVPAPQI